MEYTDYESGEAISREQFIANGLERGELLAKEECGCVIIQDRTADAYIVYCHKHKAAPRLYVALNNALPAVKYILEKITGLITAEHAEYIDVKALINQMEQALAEAGG